MRNLSSHGADHPETFRLELGLFQPFSLFNLCPQRRSSLLDNLLKVIVRTLERSQKPHDDQKEHKQHDSVPNRNKRRRICCTIEHIADKPRAGAERAHSESGPPTGSPRRDAGRQQIEGGNCPLTTSKIIQRAKNGCQRDSYDRRQDLRLTGTFLKTIHFENAV